MSLTFHFCNKIKGTEGERITFALLEVPLSAKAIFEIEAKRL